MIQNMREGFLEKMKLPKFLGENNDRRIINE